MAKAKKLSLPKEVAPKPTLFIDSQKLRGNSFRVGKKASVMVSGKITQESIDDYEARGRKSFRLEIDKIKSVSSSRSGGNRFGRRR